MRQAVALLLVATLAACGGGGDSAGAPDEGSIAAGAAPTSPEPGPLVIVGGALDADNGAIWSEVVEGRQGGGPICVLPTASGVPEESLASAVERLDRWGGAGTAEGILLTETEPARADDPVVAERLRACGGYFFTGGSQSRIVDTFRPGGRATAAYEAVMARWREGAVVAGTSAGAAMMGGRMIAGGGSLEAFETGLSTGEGEDGVLVTDGMGFFEAGWLDQHFLARGRWGRLLMTTLLEPTYAVGLGIDENTALVVDGGRGRVVGASGVVVIDARSARVEAGEQRGVTLQLVGAGDVVDLTTLAVVPEPGKERPAEAGTADGDADTDPDDAFARWALLHALTESAATGGGALSWPDPRGGTLSLVPADGFRALARAAARADSTDGVEGPQGTPHGLSVGPYEVRMAPPTPASAGAGG